MKSRIVGICFVVFSFFGCAVSQLILTDFIKNNSIAAGLEASKVNFAGFQSVKSHTGFFTVDPAFNSNLFFWFVPSQSNPATDPVILWLQGGPGGSSLVSLFLENGPFVVDSQLEVSLREDAWTKKYSVLYIDNPVSTGFSFTNGGFAQNGTIIAQHLYSALTQFFTIFKDFQKNDFYVAGESYAGKFIPTLGAKIHTENQNKPKVPISLKGFILNDGLVNPIIQNRFADALKRFNLVDTNGQKQVADIENKYVDLINKKNFSAAFELYDQLINGNHQQFPTLFNNLTGYTSWLNVLKPTAEIDFVSVFRFLVQDSVRQAIHVGETIYSLSNVQVETQLVNDIFQDVVVHVETLLNNNYKGLLFFGQFDIIVPYRESVKYIEGLKYASSKGYAKAKREIWQVDGKFAGYIKRAGILTEAMVHNAGHAAIIDQPKLVFNLVSNFISNK